MNHKVHVFISGCLTLKLSGSWNTVISSPFLYSFLPESLESPFSVLSPPGEMGMVSSGTGDEGLGVATAGIVKVAMIDLWMDCRHGREDLKLCRKEVD